MTTLRNCIILPGTSTKLAQDPTQGDRIMCARTPANLPGFTFSEFFKNVFLTLQHEKYQFFKFDVLNVSDFTRTFFTGSEKSSLFANRRAKIRIRRKFCPRAWGGFRMGTHSATASYDWYMDSCDLMAGSARSTSTANSTGARLHHRAGSRMIPDKTMKPPPRKNE